MVFSATFKTHKILQNKQQNFVVNVAQKLIQLQNSVQNAVQNKHHQMHAPTVVQNSAVVQNSVRSVAQKFSEVTYGRF